MGAAPRGLIVLGDWSNIIAGIALVISFGILCAALTFKIVALEGAAASAYKATMIAEGVLWAVGAACLATVNVIVNNASSAVVQTIICFGGLFFMISGIGDGVPGKILSVRLIIPLGNPSHGTFADACPFYGITCFMIATTMGLRSVWPLPKNKVISPFWGVACFFIGAWTIGVVGLWGPCLADGLTTYETLKGGEDLLLPPYTWTWTHFFQVVGALFLTAGAIIFGIMDNICCGSIDEKSCNTDGTSDLNNSTNSDV